MFYIRSGATWERTYLDILWSIWLLLFFLCFPHLCIRSHLTVSWFSEILNKDYWTEKQIRSTRWSHLFCMWLCGFIKKTASILFFMDYFITTLISWVITSHCSLLPRQPLGGREESLHIRVLPSRSSVKDRRNKTTLIRVHALLPSEMKILSSAMGLTSHQYVGLRWVMNHECRNCVSLCAVRVLNYLGST